MPVIRIEPVVGAEELVEREREEAVVGVAVDADLRGKLLTAGVSPGPPGRESGASSVGVEGAYSQRASRALPRRASRESQLSASMDPKRSARRRFGFRAAGTSLPSRRQIASSWETYGCGWLNRPLRLPPRPGAPFASDGPSSVTSRPTLLKIAGRSRTSLATRRASRSAEETHRFGARAHLLVWIPRRLVPCGRKPGRGPSSLSVSVRATL